jgi:hypothetical protein
MGRLTKPLVAALLFAGTLAGCATYDGGYERPYYSGYEYGPSYYYGPYYDYGPYYRYGPSYYVGPPALGFNFRYYDRDGHRHHDRGHWRRSAEHQSGSNVDRQQAAVPARAERSQARSSMRSSSAARARPAPPTRSADAAARTPRGSIGARTEERG